MKVNSTWFQKVASVLPAPMRTAALLSECDYHGASRQIACIKQLLLPRRLSLEDRLAGYHQELALRTKANTELSR
jgi:hypothetical protein